MEVTATRTNVLVIAEALTKVTGFLKGIKTTAAQTTAAQLPQRTRWRLILRPAFRQFLRRKLLGSTGPLANATG